MNFVTTSYMNPIAIWLLENERSRSWLAKKLKVTPAAVQYWFEGKYKPSKKNVKKIQIITGINLQGRY